MKVVENVSLSSMTTLKLGGPARRMLAPDNERQLVEAIADIDGRSEPLLVIGGGSNLVIADEGWDGTVVRLVTRGISKRVVGGVQQGRIGGDVDRRTSLVTLCVAAGEPWDDFVGRCVDDGLSGVECLSGIPGLVGAVPMQNVGAYGQDVSETITEVRAWDRQRREIVRFDRGDCRFAYRGSVFRGKDGHVILEVTFDLAKSMQSAPIRYTELARALGVPIGGSAPLARVREVVIALRRAKGMVVDERDPDTTSAGSFFTNPTLDESQLRALETRVRATVDPSRVMPAFPESGGRTKVSAAWLIEQAGFAKGHRLGNVAISSKHALALTNRGGATTRELLDLARAIRNGVHERFGVMLENEPVFVGVSL